MVAPRAFIPHIASLLQEYADRTAASGGLLIGDDRIGVERVLLAPDLWADVAEEALRTRADLIITLCAPETLPLNGEEGAYVRDLVTGNVSVYSIANHAAGLASEALADVLTLGGVEPLIPTRLEGYALAVVYAPEEHAEQVRLALAAAGAGSIGDYAGCAWSVTGTGEFTPRSGARPAIGAVGEHEQVKERRLEMVVPVELIPAATAALRNAHPYEEPAFSFIATHPAPSRGGQGRRGMLAEPMTVREASDLLAQNLSDDVVRVSGEAGLARRVAVMPRAGEIGVEAAIDAGADLLVSSDLTSTELTRARGAGLALIDVSHAGMMRSALQLVARLLAEGTDGTVEATVTSATQPAWT